MVQVVASCRCSDGEFQGFETTAQLEPSYQTDLPLQ